MVGENTSRFLPPAASSPIRTASAGPQFRNVTPSAGFASSGWWVSTKIGPSQAPPYGRLLPATSQPSRPPNTAPVVSTYSSTRPGRNEKMLAEGEGFEPPKACTLVVFKATFN